MKIQIQFIRNEGISQGVWRQRGLRTTNGPVESLSKKRGENTDIVSEVRVTANKQRVGEMQWFYI